MTAPERRRPLPALAFIGVLCLLTAVVWFRVIHRPDDSKATGAKACPTGTAKPHTTQKVLPRPRTVSVLVLNSTERSGIAKQTKKALTERKFKVTGAENDAPAYGGRGVIKGIAEIRYGPRAVAAAALLRYYFPRAVMKETDSSSKLVAVSLGAKFKTVVKASVVMKAVQKDHAHFGKPKPAPKPDQNC